MRLKVLVFCTVSVFCTTFSILKANAEIHFYIAETFSCLLRLKSAPEEEAVRMHPGSGDSHVL